jgi:hypothetical protein
MRIQHLILSAAVAALGFAACTKLDPLPQYGLGVDPVAAASSTTIAPAPADSLKDALTVSWTDPKYATDTNNVKYLVQIDSTGRNFSRAVTREVQGRRSTTFTARELNNILLGYGFEFNKPYDMDLRVVSSYANNNEKRNSNTIKIKATPYKIPPRVALPVTGKLFLVGDASQGGWNNPVPVPTQEFTRVDETTWVGIFTMNGGKQYLVLPENGSWSTKYSVANNSLAGLSAGGDFNFNAPDNFPGPAANGQYKVTLDFQSGKFKVEPFTQQHGLPTDIFIVGDATPGGWNNPVPAPSQRFTRINATTWEMPSLALTSGKKFLLLPENGNWGKKFGEGATSGFFVPEGSDIPAPSTSGNYKITVNFADNSIKMAKL